MLIPHGSASRLSTFIYSGVYYLKIPIYNGYYCQAYRCRSLIGYLPVYTSVIFHGHSISKKHMQIYTQLRNWVTNRITHSYFYILYSMDFFDGRVLKIPIFVLVIRTSIYLRLEYIDMPESNRYTDLPELYSTT